MDSEQQRLLDEFDARMKQLHDTRRTAKQKRDDARRRSRDSLVEAVKLVTIQAAGTVLGGGVLALFAVLAGVLQRTPAVDVLVWGSGLLGLVAGVISSRASKGKTSELQDGFEELALSVEYMRRITEARKSAAETEDGEPGTVGP